MDLSQLPTCSTFHSETGDWWNGAWDDELDDMDTIDDVNESVIPLALLLRTTPPTDPPSGVTAALVGLERMEPLIWESRAGRPSCPELPTG
jgi:hypothetical protein